MKTNKSVQCKGHSNLYLRAMLAGCAVSAWGVGRTLWFSAPFYIIVAYVVITSCTHMRSSLQCAYIY